MRTAVVDIGTNSTRLLVADVEQTTGTVKELHRESRVTRLGDKVDAGGTLSAAAIGRVQSTLENYRATIDSYRCEANLAVLTSAVRDAANGAEFTELVRSQFGLDARVLSGEEEAQLTFLGAMSDRDAATAAEPTVVIDIGGGSTEFIVGADHTASFHVSVQAGVLRMSERHIHSDPPSPTSCRIWPPTPARSSSTACPSSSAKRSRALSRLPAPPPQPPRSTRSSIPMTPSACTATSCCSPPWSC